jgi:hypothetical protein
MRLAGMGVPAIALRLMPAPTRHGKAARFADTVYCTDLGNSVLNISKKPAFIFGAGATKACGGPITNEILPLAFTPEFRNRMKRNDYLERIDSCLIRHFHLPANPEERQPDDYPSLTLMLSVLDLAIDQKRPFEDTWDVASLAECRSALEYAIFSVLDLALERVQVDYYKRLLETFRDRIGAAPEVLSLNYDLMADNVLFGLADERNSRPDYGCDIQTEAYRTAPVHGRILKLHGSLNWLYCPSCQRLDIGMSESCGRRTTSHLVRQLVEHRPLDTSFQCASCTCDRCNTQLRPVLVTPSFAKQYTNPHLQSVWYQAERMLRNCDHVYFVGYSLPEDDIHVIHLLRRGLAHLPSNGITVVGKLDNDSSWPIRRRYKSLFGPDIEWHCDGLAAWLEAIAPEALAAKA